MGRYQGLQPVGYEFRDRTILEDLIQTVQFRDDYVGGGIDPNGRVHGPYMLEAVTPDAFAPTDSRALLNIFGKWSHQCGSLPEKLRNILHSQVVIPIETATSGFRLRDLGALAKNDYADIHNEFHEFVLINRNERRLTKIVATDD